MNENSKFPKVYSKKIEYDAFKIVEMQIACLYLSNVLIKSFAK